MSVATVCTRAENHRHGVDGRHPSARHLRDSSPGSGGRYLLDGPRTVRCLLNAHRPRGHNRLLTPPINQPVGAKVPKSAKGHRPLQPI